MRILSPARDATGLLLPMLLGSLSFGILAFVLPVYGKRLGASALEIGGLFSILAVTMTVIRPFIGWALDRFGRKFFFVAGLAARAGSMAIFAFAGDLGGLYLARLIQGIAASLTWIPAYTIATDISAAPERGKSVGRVDESAARGELFGSLAGFGLLALIPLDLGWKLLFAAYGLLALLGAWVGWRRVPVTHSGKTPATPGERRWGIPAELGKLMVVVFVTGASMSMISPLLMILLQDKFTTQLSVLAIAYLPASMVNSFLPSRMGRLSDHLGRAPLIAVGLAGSGVVSLFLPGLPSVAWLILLWMVEALGWAMAAPAQEALVADLCGRDTRGTGYGLYSFSGSLGATFGPLVGGWLYDTAGHGVPFYLNAVVMLAGAVWVLAMLPRRPVQPASAA